MRCPECGSETEILHWEVDGTRGADFMFCPVCGHEEKVGGEKE
jgi:Zn ribbon nucleic-acid-binding protein